jgi:hypothetical protein
MWKSKGAIPSNARIAGGMILCLSGRIHLGLSIVEFATNVDATLRRENRQSESCERLHSSFTTLASQDLDTTVRSSLHNDNANNPGSG